MFLRTYGLLYEQNSDIFIDLFVNLRSNYDASESVPSGHRHRYADDSDVRTSLDRFFVVLMRRMLTLLNQHRTAPPTEQFLHCVSSRIDQLRPFGDVPSKLSVQLRRAFAAARAFVVGLTTGSEVIATLSKVCGHHRFSAGSTPSSICRKAVFYT